MTTAAPLQLQMVGIIGIGLVGLALSAGLVGLVLGRRRIGWRSGALADPDALRLGVAAGLVGAGVRRRRLSDRLPALGTADVDAAGAVVPGLQAAIEPVPRVLMARRFLSAVLTVDH